MKFESKYGLNERVFVDDIKMTGIVITIGFDRDIPYPIYRLFLENTATISIPEMRIRQENMGKENGNAEG